ncbi:MAG: hypothetical protein AAFX02_00670 [Pseudomonadota bacterium]
MVTFTCVLQDEKTQPLEGLVLIIHPLRQPRRVLFRGTSNGKGYVDVTIDDGVRAKFVVARVFDPESEMLLHRTPQRALEEISKWWAIEVPNQEDNPDREPDLSDIDTDEGDDHIDIEPLPSARDMQAKRVQLARSLREGLRGATSEEILRRRSRLREGRKIGRRLIGRRPLLGAGKLKRGAFVPANEDTTTQEAASRDSTLKGWGELSGRLRGLTVSEADTESLGLKDDEKVPASAILEILSVLSRRRPARSAVDELLLECAAAKESEALEDPKDDDTSSDVSGTSFDGHSPSAIERVAAILDTLEASPARRPSAEDVSQSLTMHVPSGPADVDAFYDFHALQIAWEDTWTAAVDPDMQDQIKAIYDAIVDLVEPEHVDADLSEIDEIDDFTETVGDIVDAADTTMSGTVDNAPAWIRDWVPVLADVWVLLTDTEQEYIRVQWEIEEYLRPKLPAGGHSWKGLRQRSLFDAVPDDFLPRGPEKALVIELAANPNRYQKRATRYVDLESARAAMNRAATGGRNSTSSGRRPSGAKPLRKRPRQEGADQTPPRNAADRLSRLKRLMEDLKIAAVEPYQFDVFAPGSYNFGLVTTYRQRWRPLSYQAGDLAGAVPLAPNEKRTYKVTRTVSERQQRDSEHTRSLTRTRESESKRRAESEISENAKRMMKAGGVIHTKSNIMGAFDLTTNSTFDISEKATRTERRKRSGKSPGRPRRNTKTIIKFLYRSKPKRSERSLRHGNWKTQTMNSPLPICSTSFNVGMRFLNGCMTSSQ